jgi:hypothetical protein
VEKLWQAVDNYLGERTWTIVCEKIFPESAKKTHVGSS